MKKTKNRMQHNENVVGWIFIAPALICFILLTSIPFFMSIGLSLVDWNFFGGLNKLKFVGFQNFIDLTKDKDFIRAMKNTVIYVITIVPLSLGFSLVFSYCMNGRIFGKKILRMMFFIPYICSIVAVGAVFRFLFSDGGIVNNFLMNLNIISSPIKWAVDERYSKIPIILLSTWTSIGYQMILLTAAMQNVSASLYEASKIDGAGGFMQFFKITLPMISPTIFYIIITRMMAVFKIFGSINIFTSGSTVKTNSSAVIEIYQTAFRDYDFGMASAMSMVLFTFILAVTIINFWGQKKWVHY